MRRKCGCGATKTSFEGSSEAACLSGSVYFRGNDRSPGDRAVDVGKSAAEILGHVLPEVFDRFKEAAAQADGCEEGRRRAVQRREPSGASFRIREPWACSETKRARRSSASRADRLPKVLSRIEERANYGDTASGRYLSDEFAKEPFGWDFEVVRLLVLSLLRAGKIEATSKGQTIDSATGIEARDTFSNNNLFRQASFRPKKGIEFEELVKASEAFRDTFGTEVRELNAGAIVAELRKEVARHEDTVASAHGQLTAHRLPGGAVLEGALGQMKAILRGSEDNAIATFNASHRSIKDAIKRAVELEQALSEPRLRDIERARQALSVAWPFLDKEPDLSEDLRSRAIELQDLFSRETFFRDLPAIEQHAGAIESEYARRFEDSLQARVEAYTKAFDQLTKTPGWSELQEDVQRSIAAPIQSGMTRAPATVPIALLRSERDACEGTPARRGPSSPGDYRGRAAGARQCRSLL